MPITVNVPEPPPDERPPDPEDLVAQQDPGRVERAEEPSPGASGPPNAEPPPGKVKLFSIDGKDYFIPKEPGPNVSVRYLRDVRKHGQDYAVAGLMEAMLGEDGVDALAEYEELTEEDLDHIMEAVKRHALGRGTKKGPAGKGRRP